MERLLFDLSFTRTQTHPTGMSRTANRLLEAMAAAAAGTVVPVSYHRGGLRALQPRAGSAATAAPAPAQRPGRLQRWLVDAVAPRVSALLPMPARRWAWTTYHRWRYDRYSAGDGPVTVRPGDVLFLCDASWNYEIWRAARKARTAGAQVVLLVQDIMPIRQPEFCSPIFAWVFLRWLKNILACSDAVICNSRTTEADVRDWAASAGIALPPTGNVRLGHDASNGVPAGTVRPQLAGFMAAPGAVFASVGTVEPKKNYGFLLDTFERLWARGLDMRLVIAGRPTAQCEALLERMSHHPEQGRRLLNLTDASDAEVACLYGQARALLLASRFEGFGLPLVEARTKGCPVIAADLPVFRELADAGVLLYPQGSHEALEQGVMRLAGTARDPQLPAMAPFTWDDCARQCLDALRLLPAQRRGG